MKPAKGFLVAQSGKKHCVLQGVCLGRHEVFAMTRAEPRTCHELGAGPSGKPASVRMSLGVACPSSVIALIFLDILLVIVFEVTGPAEARADGGRISGVVSLL